jgi:hypothetical protein
MKACKKNYISEFLILLYFLGSMHIFVDEWLGGQGSVLGRVAACFSV